MKPLYALLGLSIIIGGCAPLPKLHTMPPKAPAVHAKKVVTKLPTPNVVVKKRWHFFHVKKS
jgi:hypothetical protein